MTKYILVSGGVVSGIGKGVIGLFFLHPFSWNSAEYDHDIVVNELERVSKTASSTGLLLRMAGLKVTAIKIDPYMNIDAGTMRPTEHGQFSLPLDAFFACDLAYIELNLLAFLHSR